MEGGGNDFAFQIQRFQGGITVGILLLFADAFFWAIVITEKISAALPISG